VRLGLVRFSPYHERPAELGLEIVGPLPYYRLIYGVEEPTLTQLASWFEYRHADGRDPERHVEPARQAIERWQASREMGYRSLRYRRGPGFLVIRDRRPGLESADYTLDEVEAHIYLACDDGATPAAACEAARAAGSTDLSVNEVRDFLDGLVESRLVHREDGRYLSLALSANLVEETQ
jgi:hypothetical protein